MIQKNISKYYPSGTNKVMCARCGHNFPNTYMKKDVNTGTWVCTHKGYGCWNPKDVMLKTIPFGNVTSVYNAPPSFSDEVYCYSDAIADVAIADCCYADTVAEQVALSNG